MKITKLFMFAALAVGLCVNTSFGQSGNRNVPPVVQGGGNTARIVTAQPNTVAPIVNPSTTPIVQGSGAANNSTGGSDYFSEGNFVESNGRFGGGSILNGAAPPSSWVNERGRVYGSLLYMTRERQGSDFNLIVDNANNPVLTNDSFDFDYEPGFEVGFRTSVAGFCEVDARFMQLDNLNSQIVPFNLAAAGALVTNPQTGIGMGNHSARYGSNLYSGEVNFLRQFATNTKMGLGFRMIQLNELLEMDFNFAASNSDIDIQTRNYLYGAQFVSETLLLHTNRCRWDFMSKSGIFGNTASRNMTTTNPNIFQRLEDREATFVGESAIRCSIRVSNCLSISGGYQAIYMAGVALAPDQVQNTNDAATNFFPLETDMSDTLYHGAFIGIEFRR